MRLDFILRVVFVVICVGVMVGILCWIESDGGCDLGQHWSNSEKSLHDGKTCQLPNPSEECRSLESAKSGNIPSSSPVSKFDPARLTDDTLSLQMEEQMHLAASVFGIDFQKDVVSDTVVNSRQFLGPLRELTLQDRRVVRFDIATSQLVTVMALQLEDVPHYLTKDDAISEDQALTIVRNLLKALNINYQTEKMEYQTAFYVGPDSKEMLMGAEWVMRGSLKYKGIPYLGAAIRIAVSAYSGKVGAYSYIPIGPMPSSLDEKIDAKQAVKIVKKFLGPGLWFSFPRRKICTPTKCIALSNNYWSRAPGEKVVRDNTPYLCWIVPVDNGQDFPLRIFVDAQTGDIRGGM